MYWTRALLSILITFFTIQQTHSQDWHPLYDRTPPGNLKDTASDPNPLKDPLHPALLVFEAPKDKANGTGLLIFPGGGYGGLSWTNEGVNIAKAFNEKGVTCFIVKYRLPDPKLFSNTESIPLTDAIEAMRWVKERSAQYNIDTTKLGCIGFSAGGHLASTLGTHAPSDASPKFMILVYPVITMQKEWTHMGSRGNLLGRQPTGDMVDEYSNELQVTDATCPAYITHTGDDHVVPVRNSIMMYEALQKHGINAELHLYPKGDHGFIINLPVREWQDPMLDWMRRSGFVTPDIDGSGKTVILAFDDASQSHYSNIPAMLKRYKFGATFYVCEFPPDFSDSTKYMNWRQIRELSKMGYEIGNHTWHHHAVIGASDSTLESEIGYIDNKCRQLSIPKPTSFCYPGYATDSACIPILKKHGYLTARTGGDRAWQPGRDHPYYVPAYTISGNNPTYFYNALQTATTNNAIVFCVHGVPDNAHDWVNTDPQIFEAYLKYLYDHHFTVVSMCSYTQKNKKSITTRLNLK